jgi:branched-chain amino acid aminotransferase
LLSITNRSLSELAAHYFGWNVERRQIPWKEVMEGGFDEIAACGTAVVITPVDEIQREYCITEPNIIPNTDIETFWDDFDQPVEIKVEKYRSNSTFEGFKKLHDLYRGIQCGDVPDEYNWMYPAKGIEH